MLCWITWPARPVLKHSDAAACWSFFGTGQRTELRLDLALGFVTLPRLQGVYKAARSERKIGAMAIYTDIDFMSEAHVLRGRHYAAAPESSDGASAPCVIMAHGTSATISMALDKYAAAFQSAGLNVVLYDYACLGASGGAQRQVINPWVQARL